MAPDDKLDFVSQADLKLVRDQVDQLQVIVTEPRRPWYLEPSNLWSFLAVVVSLISFIISTNQGDQKELREKREEFRGVLDKLVLLSEEKSKRRRIGEAVGFIELNQGLYRSSADTLARELGDRVLHAEHIILGDEFAKDSQENKRAVQYFSQALQTARNPIERSRALVRLAYVQGLPPFRKVNEMRRHYADALAAVSGESDDLKFEAGQVLIDWALDEKRLRHMDEFWSKATLARRSFLEMSPDDPNRDNGLNQVMAVERKARDEQGQRSPLSDPPSLWAPRPFSLWPSRPRLLDDGIQHRGRLGLSPSTGAGSVQP
ncbi:hypothetical protein KBZ20_06690 [Vulcanococcus limneticus Candia 3F8]|uniref:hypothetical protein n=1 Tax=Vulcanococcus limneticus TaxID=2170428 RepID=UPI0012FF77F9|nr:hypothetical protein [Vulcanococcus limneticus]MCP9791600.1 hypothetical protein [Vulcanococcus limneticus MW73D5]MCP9893456.1 hypothetical protein [Vulcanococcus limneticus Candia 3F8]MCP9896986.1 hypothetical protein [Vulcanococcus limneticus Candia 3B3]